MDPLWSIASLNRFAYVLNTPIRFIDPAGLKCTVCPGITKHLRTEIDPLDNNYVGTPFRDSADGHTRTVNKLIANFGISYPIPLPSTGLHAIIAKGRNEGALGFLFFIVFNICETKDPLGECLLFLDETGSQTSIGKNDGTLRVVGGENFGDVTAVSTMKPTRLVPIGLCDKSIVFTDFPMGEFVNGTTSMRKKLRQKIEIKDSATNMIVAQITNNLDFSVDLQGNIRPPEDFLWIQEPKN